MKILFVTYIDFPLEVGGFQNQVRCIEKYLKKYGIEVVWQDLEHNVISSCDIVHVFSSVPSLLPVMKKARSLGKQILITPMVGSRKRSNTYLRFCLKLSTIPQICNSIKEGALTIKEADFWTPLSSFEANRLHNVYGIDYKNIRVITNGIDDEFFRDTDVQVNIPYSEYILIVGRIEYNKNQLSVIEAVNKIGLNLIIVGEPGIHGIPYYNKCKALSKNNIYYWGVEHNVVVLKELYRKASATVVASYSEMVPLVVFESLQMNTPVVCTNRCSISKDKIQGVIFSGITVNALISSIKKAIKLKVNDIDKNQIYSWNDIALQYKEVYEFLLNKCKDK